MFVFVQENGVLALNVSPEMPGAVELSGANQKIVLAILNAGGIPIFQNGKVKELRSWDSRIGKLARERRNELAQEADYKINAIVDRARTGEQGLETLELLWRFYRQALRDIPETFAEPDNVVWPTKPE